MPQLLYHPGERTPSTSQYPIRVMDMVDPTAGLKKKMYLVPHGKEP
jgi:hypothetical protein